jgi:hypothetical protein
MPVDLGILVTGIAATLCLVFGRGDFLRHVLFIAWATIALETMAGVRMSFMVMTMALLDLLIAAVALARVHHDQENYRARFIGFVSMALMPLHWTISATQGAVSWVLYASVVNAGFVAQCLTMMGWFDGVGRSIRSLFRRGDRVHSLRRRGW